MINSPWKYFTFLKCCPKVSPCVKIVSNTKQTKSSSGQCCAHVQPRQWMTQVCFETGFSGQEEGGAGKGSSSHWCWVSTTAGGCQVPTGDECSLIWPEDVSGQKEDGGW